MKTPGRSDQHLDEHDVCNLQLVTCNFVTSFPLLLDQLPIRLELRFGTGLGIFLEVPHAIGNDALDDEAIQIGAQG